MELKDYYSKRVYYKYIGYGTVIGGTDALLLVKFDKFGGGHDGIASRREFIFGKPSEKGAGDCYFDTPEEIELINEIVSYEIY